MSEPEGNETVFDRSDDSEPTSEREHRRHHRTGGGAAFKPLLVCLEGPHRGMRFPLHAADLVIGRGPQADIRLEDEMISRRHARIMWHNFDHPDEVPQCTCEDLGSRNGTELNGAPLIGRTPLRDRDRLFLGATVLGFFLRDAEEIEIDRTLYELATKDALTGLDNRHQFEALLRHHIERVRRYGHSVALLLIDADRFKSVNDTYGHDVGDLALKHLARLISTSCRSTEICARWGGEEFVILAPECDAEGAITLAERVRTRVASLELETAYAKIPLTVSIGVTLLVSGDTLESAFRRADQSLLTAKELGRNRTVFEGTPVGVDRTATFKKKPPLSES